MKVLERRIKIIKVSAKEESWVGERYFQSFALEVLNLAMDVDSVINTAI